MRFSAWTSSVRRTSSPFSVRAKSSAFLSQPFHVAEVFTGTKGQYVSIAETVRGFKEILDGKHDEVPEQNFYMKGGIDMIKE